MEHELKAACLAIGTELLGDVKLDRNSLEVTRVLAGCGVEVVEKRVVGDRREDIGTAVRELLDRVDVVVATGGLGPTADDVTRESVAEALGRLLVHDPGLEDGIRSRYAASGRETPEIAVAMADLVEGARPLLSGRGVAPGQLLEVDDRILVLLPGVTWEMSEMLARHVAPELVRRGATGRLIRRTLLIAGVFESDVEPRVRPLYRRFGRDAISILASRGQIRLELRPPVSVDDPAAVLMEMETAFRDALGEDVAGVDVSGIEEVLLEELRRRSHTLATAESCTGGLVGARLTTVPGSSDVYLGGVVSYTNQAKERFLDVPHQVLVENGAVSERVARAMAAGARDRFDATWGLGVTGIAGPGGGTADKPVGLVHWAVAGPDGVRHGHRVFPGPRDVVRHFSATMALDLVRRFVLEVGEAG